MRKLALAVPFLLALAACGADSSCPTSAAQLTSLATGCTLAPGTSVSLKATAACVSCAQTSPSCAGENVGGQIELNPVFQECTDNSSCTGGCTFGAFTCNFVTPNASQVLTVVYPSTASGGLTTTTVNVAAGGQTSCTL